MSFPGGSVVKNQPADTRDTGDRGSIPGLARSPGEGNGNLLQILLPGYSHEHRHLAGYTPWDCKESDMIKPPSSVS